MPAHKISVLSFLLDGIHQYDVGMILDKMGDCRQDRYSLHPAGHGSFRHFRNDTCINGFLQY